MTNLRSLLSASAPAAPSAASATSAPANRQRLRAVAPDEVPPVADLLHPGATWLPAPPHTLPTLPGHPPMVGYLVLVPADRQRPEAAGPPPEGIPAVTGETGERGEELIRIDPDHRTAEVAGRPLDLTYLEFELLSHLVAHPHRVHSRDQLVTTVWGYGHVGDGRTVDVHVARLRRKMGPEHRGTIVTVRRVGYKYVPTV
ncbi:winged helix-turn-helix domain-containing protein [Streptomyces sp. 11-1-2]|uniref:winged helix-turn-helix domain-containing protein n=1 Tax=unclassified Streptomyces TaxID=2593676 RepID=UPI000B8D91AF|nr:winged helix-turn-helix domain-containing protein [Streptomyces sp. 11-1-2]ASQ94188.1 transcriptional regulator [Streptomyces sp. 11-1-2]